MRAKEFGAERSRNVGKGGQKPSYDRFNKSLKGSERNPSAKEYYNQGLEEYHKYAEMLDTRNDSEEKDNNYSQDNQSSKNSANKSNGALRNIVVRVAAVAMGAVIIVNTYQTIQSHENNLIPEVASMSWNWDEGKDSADLQLFDSENNLIREVPASVTKTIEEATCENEGRITYTATVLDGDTSYTDTQVEVINKLSHNYVFKSEEIGENGEHTIYYECSQCHDVKTVTVYIEEE